MKPSMHTYGMDIQPTLTLWSEWLKIRAQFEGNLRNVELPDDLIRGLENGTILDERVKFLSNLITDDAIKSIARARIILLGFLYLIDEEMQILNGMKNILNYYSSKESSIARMLCSSCREKSKLNKLNSIEASLLVGIAAENLEYDWPLPSGEWRKNLSISNNLGEFFTPHEIITDILNNTINCEVSKKSVIYIIDPFSGVGNFINLCSYKLKKLNLTCTKIYITIEKNPLFHAISLDLLSHLNNDFESTHSFWGDSLLLRDYGSNSNLLSLLSSCDIVVTNPPFSRMKFHKSEVLQKESYLGEFNEKDIARYISAKKEEINNYKIQLAKYKELQPAMQGEWDLYRLSLMRAISFLNANGQLGIITPCSILGDFRSSNIRKYILNNFSIYNIKILSENLKLFRTVNQPTSIFALKKDNKLITHFHGKIESLDDLYNDESYLIPNQEILNCFEEPYAIPICDSELLDLYRGSNQLPKLRDHIEGGVKRGELDLTAHKKYLINDKNFPTLVRGDNIERYSIRPHSNNRKISNVLASDFLNDTKIGQKDLMLQRRLVGRQCSYMGKRRRLSWVIIEPPAIVSNSCNYISQKSSSLNLEALEVLLNSAFLDWMFRSSSTNNHVGNYEVEKLPITNLSEAEIRKLSDYSLQLRDYYVKHPFGYSNQKNNLIEYEVDKYILDIYGANEIEAKLILSYYY